MTIVFNTSIWLQERAIMHISGIGTNNHIVVSGTDTAIQASYNPASNGTLDIDVVDLARIGESEIVVAEYNASGSIVGTSRTFMLSVKGNKDVDKMLIPNHSQYSADLSIPLPYRIVEPIGIPLAYDLVVAQDTEFPNGVLVEFGGSVQDIQYTTLTKTGGAIGKVTDGLKRIAIGKNYRGGTFPIFDLLVAYSTQQAKCNREYATVQWIGRSGVVKRFVFEVRKNTISNKTTTEYLTLDNSYLEHKGQEYALILSLDQLTPYDYWYYADMIESDDVRVAIHDTDYDTATGMIPERCRVAITTKKLTIPDGNGLSTIEIECNYKRYDEI